MSEAKATTVEDKKAAKREKRLEAKRAKKAEIQQARASLGYATHYAARCAPRKARLLTGLVVGKSAAKAIATLAVERRAGSVEAIKIIRSAMAQLPSSVAANAVVTEFVVNEGPKRKMYMPRAMGRAAPVYKRTSHLTVKVKIAE